MREGYEIKHNPQKSFGMVTVLGGGAKNRLIKWVELHNFFPIEFYSKKISEFKPFLIATCSYIVSECIDSLTSYFQKGGGAITLFFRLLNFVQIELLLFSFLNTFPVT
jgi:hypothetical protein